MNIKKDKPYFERDNLILKLSFEFSLNIVKYCELLNERKKFVIANQLLRSGTSIGANIREAQNGESKQDFIHKFKIAAKEAEETEYWLLICKHSENYPDAESLVSDLISLKRIISKIISSQGETLNHHRIIELPNHRIKESSSNYRITKSSN